MPQLTDNRELAHIYDPFLFPAARPVNVKYRRRKLRKASAIAAREQPIVKIDEV